MPARLVGVFAGVMLFLNAGCAEFQNRQSSFSEQSSAAQSSHTLTLYGLSQGDSARQEIVTLKEFGERHNVPVEYLPSGGDAVDHQLELYREIFRRHYSRPDILAIDTTWPALLAPNLIDLRPYLPEAIAAASPVQIQNNTVNGRVVAIPNLIDFAVLYYRPVLLKRYGFQHPPETWDELEHMARIIQNGERRAGNREFWGYGWSGGNNESSTCDALEWFLSNSGSNFVEQDGSVQINTPENVNALKRAVSWIGTISPSGVPLYHESDVDNLWRSGQAAFVKGWVNSVHASDGPVGGDRLPFEIAPVPGGPKGHYGTLGDMSLGVSKFAANRDLAITALREFSSAALQRRRLLQFGVMPTRLELLRRPETVNYTMLRNPIARKSLSTLAIRPSTVLGEHYDAVTHAISATVSSVLFRRDTPEAALAGLQNRVESIVQQR